MGREVRCLSCKGKSNVKTRPYGADKRTRSWCDGCDKEYVAPEPSKKAERQRARRDIKNGQS